MSYHHHTLHFYEIEAIALLTSIFRARGGCCGVGVRVGGESGRGGGGGGGGGARTGKLRTVLLLDCHDMGAAKGLAPDCFVCGFADADPAMNQQLHEYEESVFSGRSIRPADSASEFDSQN